ncbi:AbrB/MazE/SpoVT family DNA-binding domain-containing protein [Thiomicrorhabdus aquaedulcis]|uniref:AbrB/MazE/SpoVT family DNA-binding domain-containing protein n=1 Tax=Thiomicrorhabdus aquaedulcis TaxID=2211106 RepID=UPI000FD6BB23|nr:AbrB/MazE/SpoVT family DNA-binding domain-containing protein [Thiomicrorhabdus aquaedulcis]
MQTSVRKVGNSAGMTIPASLLKSQGLNIGDTLDIEEHPDYWIVKKVTTKPKYQLSELIAQCNPNALQDNTLQAWESNEKVGNEVW